MGRSRCANSAKPNREVFKLVGETRLGVPRLCGKTKKGSRKRYWLAGAKASLCLRLHPRCSRRNRDHAGQNCDRSEIPVFVIGSETRCLAFGEPPDAAG